jgi:putative NIF3 family GTP cyclohydrolase 1 type 2
MTVQQIVDQIKKSAGVTLHTGSGDASVTGIAVTYTPTLDVLRKAADSGRNVIVSREGPYWTRKPDALASNPAYQFKRDYIEKNRLAVLQLRDDRSLQGLAQALGWGDRTNPEDLYFKLPETTLESLSKSIESKLKIHAARVIGDPTLKVNKVALTHGRMLVPALQKVLKEPGVDVVIIGEPVEWEASPYFQDLIASGARKGLIAIGLEASEEPGGKLTAAWLQSLFPDVMKVEWIPAGEPFWVLS